MKRKYLTVKEFLSRPERDPEVYVETYWPSWSSKSNTTTVAHGAVTDIKWSHAEKTLCFQEGGMNTVRFKNMNTALKNLPLLGDTPEDLTDPFRISVYTMVETEDKTAALPAAPARKPAPRKKGVKTGSGHLGDAVAKTALSMQKILHRLNHYDNPAAAPINHLIVDLLPLDFGYQYKMHEDFAGVIPDFSQMDDSENRMMIKFPDGYVREMGLFLMAPWDNGFPARTTERVYNREKFVVLDRHPNDEKFPETFIPVVGRVSPQVFWTAPGDSFSTDTVELRTREVPKSTGELEVICEFLGPCGHFH